MEEGMRETQEHYGINETWNTGTGGYDGGEAGEREEQTRQTCKAARKQFSKLGWMYVAGTAVIYAVQIGVAMIINLLRPAWLLDPDLSIIISMLPMYLIGIPILVLLVRTVPAGRPERHKMKGGQFVLSVLMCFAAMYLCNLAGTMLTALIGILKGSAVRNELESIIMPSSQLVVFFFTVLCAPVIEEYVFRKLIVDRAILYGQGVAILLSGLMFGLFHGNLNQFVYATGLGLFLAFLYVKTGNLKITIALHMIVNFLGGVVSTQILKLIDMEAYMEVVARGDMQGVLSYLADHLVGWILFLLYACVVFGCAIAGGVLFIVFACKGRFRLDKDKAVLPKGRRFRTVILNSGILVYCIVWTGLIIRQLFL